MSSQRIVFLTILTAFLYALTLFFETGVFLFPFGIFKPALFVAALILIINERKLKLPEWLLLFATCLLSFSSKFLIQICLPNYETTGIDIELITSLALIGFGLVFLAWQINIALPEKSIYRLLQLVNAFVMSACLFTNQWTWYLVPSLMWVMSVYLSKNVPTLHKSFAFLYVVLLCCAFVSALFFGAKVVISHL